MDIYVKPVGVFWLNLFGTAFLRTCTNNPSWIEKLLSLETLPDSAFEGTQLSEMSNRTGCSSYINLAVLLGGKNDLSRKSSVMLFLRNAILLCLNIFPRNYILEESVLAAEEIVMTKMDSSTASVNPSRGLAKSLLKNDRQVILLHLLFVWVDYGNFISEYWSGKHSSSTRYEKSLVVFLFLVATCSSILIWVLLRRFLQLNQLSYIFWFNVIYNLVCFV